MCIIIWFGSIYLKLFWFLMADSLGGHWSFGSMEDWYLTTDPRRGGSKWAWTGQIIQPKLGIKHVIIDPALNPIHRPTIGPLYYLVCLKIKLSKRITFSLARTSLKGYQVYKLSWSWWVLTISYFQLYLLFVFFFYVIYLYFSNLFIIIILSFICYIY